MDAMENDKSAKPQMHKIAQNMIVSNESLFETRFSIHSFNIASKYRVFK